MSMSMYTEVALYNYYEVYRYFIRMSMIHFVIIITPNVTITSANILYKF